MAKKYWITRNGQKKCYEIWSKNPEWDEVDKMWDAWGVCSIEIIDADNFESLTDIKLPGGKDSIVCITGFKAIKAVDVL